MENGNHCNCKKTWFIVIAIIILIALIWFIIRISCCAAEPSCPTANCAAVEQITEENFDNKTAQGIVLVEFFSPDCTICKGQAAAIEEIVALLPDGVAIMQINYQDAPTCANKHQVKSVPTWIKFKDGKEIKRFNGMLDKDGLKKFACEDSNELCKATEKCVKDLGKAVKDSAKEMDKEIKKEAEELKTL